mgnify:CR=1 FL=1
MKLVPTVLAAAVAVLSLTAHATEFKSADIHNSDDYPTVTAVKFMSDELKKATGGKHSIKVFNKGALGTEKETIDQVKIGALDMVRVNISPMNSVCAKTNIPVLPFLFRSVDHLHKVLDGPIGEEIAKDCEAQGFVLLAYYDSGARSIYSKKPINSAADLRGVKWRAYSPATTDIARLVGAQPVTVQAAELSQALATGVVEANMTSGATGVDSKLYEHLKFYYDVQAWLPKNAVIVNKKAFDALDKPTQDAVLKAAADAEVRGWNASKKVNVESLDKLKANGMTIHTPSAQLKADMQKVGETMLKEWSDKAGADGQALLSNYRK